MELVPRYPYCRNVEIGSAHPSSSLDARATTEDIAWLQDKFERVVANVENFVRRKDAVVGLAVTYLLAEGHILIEDVPGVGSTVLAKVLSASCKASHARVQFTPDLLPDDVTGTLVYAKGPATSASIPARPSATSCCATRSTGPRRRPGRRCSKSWRSVK